MVDRWFLWTDDVWLIVLDALCQFGYSSWIWYDWLIVVVVAVNINGDISIINVVIYIIVVYSITQPQWLNVKYRVTITLDTLDTLYIIVIILDRLCTRILVLLTVITTIAIEVTDIIDTFIITYNSISTIHYWWADCVWWIRWSVLFLFKLFKLLLLLLLFPQHYLVYFSHRRTNQTHWKLIALWL